MYYACLPLEFSSLVLYILLLLISCFEKEKEVVRIKEEENKIEKKIYSNFLPHFKTYENKVCYYASSLFEMLDEKENLEK